MSRERAVRPGYGKFQVGDLVCWEFEMRPRDPFVECFRKRHNAIIAFLSLILFAKLLQPSDFGVFSVSLAVVEVASLFTNMLFHDALIQRSDITDGISTAR